ncbi:hypothetical protein [Amnibacterium sp.]|nr:hypothetical protein [Amnibacterium sp.]MCU1474485.1 hypothetical protein [Amnibacterium sp.]
MSDTNPAVDPPEPESPQAVVEPHAAGASGDERVGDAPALLPRDAGEMMT